MRPIIRMFFFVLRRLLMPFMWLYAALSKPKPISRETAAQALVDDACRQLTLYQFNTCPFCIKVKKEVHRLALPITMANIQKDAEARDKLVRHGGKSQVPCLHIVHEGGEEQWLYESGDITRYLQQRFAA
ncbi:glutaredoxin family protein [Shewanella sp. YIC-542]|uniref:glutaredoxin family protein n=1 Tax=Shewanella mytili TaxID=3377111 RepID=UPI00398EF83A